MQSAKSLPSHRSWALIGASRKDNRYHSIRASPVQAEHLWFRIVSLDRHLSLLLGPSQGTRSVVMASAAVLRQRTVIACLECLHCVVQRAEVIRKEPR